MHNNRHDVRILMCSYVLCCSVQRSLVDMRNVMELRANFDIRKIRPPPLTDTFPALRTHEPRRGIDDISNLQV